jgi:hypothetical protein
LANEGLQNIRKEAAQTGAKSGQLHQDLFKAEERLEREKRLTEIEIGKLHPTLWNEGKRNS